MSLLKSVPLTFFCSWLCLAAEPPGIPFESVKGLVYIQASVNGSASLPFVLDTGASISIVSPETAKLLSLHPAGAIAAAGPGRGGDQSMKLAAGISFRVGETELKNQATAILSLDYIERQAGHRTAGILSVGAFAGRIVQVDYAARVVRFIDPAAFSPSPEDREVPLVIGGNVPFVQVEIGLPHQISLTGTFILDSGFSGATILFSKPFLARHPELLQVAGLHNLPNIEAVGGKMEMQAAPIPFLRLGPFAIENPVAMFSLNGAGVLDNPQIDGILGCKTLIRFRVTYDYPHSRMFLAPDSGPSAPAEKENHLIVGRPADSAGRIEKLPEF